MARRLAIPLLCLFLAVGIRAADSLKIILFPPEGLTKDSELSWLNEGIAYSISQQIEGRGISAIKRKERALLVESMDLPPGAQLSHASMIRVAQRAGADILVMGTCSGTRQNLKISLRALDIRTMKLSGEMVANGPFSALAQMENELAWLILSNTELEKSLSRGSFQLRTRKAPNQAYAFFIESFSAGNDSDRMNSLLKALQLYRDFREVRLQLGGFYFQKENCGKALSYLNMENGDRGADLEIQFMQGTCNVEEDLLNQAIQSLSRVLSSSRSLEVFNNLGVAYLRKGDYGLALNVLLEARNLNNADSTVALNLGIVRHLQRNDWAARNSLDEAVKLRPRDGMLHFMSGFLFQAQGEKEKASAAFGKAKTLRINVDRLLTQTPKSWARLIYEFPEFPASNSLP